MIEREESMVERVAKALFRQSVYHGYNEETLLAEWSRTANIHRAAARAAIEAMREPDYEMCIKGQPAINLSEKRGKYEFLSREEISVWELVGRLF